MPKLSTRDTVQVDMGPGSEAAAELGEYKVSYVTVHQDTDLTPLLQGLPNDECGCPHWGYVVAGRMWWRFGDHEESHGPGDAFFVPGGHTSGADAGSTFVIFSPTEQIAVVEAHMMARAQALFPAAE
jgi:hypothetical protein